MSVQTNIFFKNIDGYGWSERYWYNGTASDPTVVTDLNALLTARAQLSTTSVTITHARMGTTTPRNPRIFALNSGAGIPCTQDPPTGPSEVAILMRMNAGSVGFNRLFIRGIPERVFQSDEYLPDPAYVTVMNSFITALQVGKWNAVGTLGSSTIRHLMTGLVPTPPKGYQATITTGSGLIPGDEIRVHGQAVVGYNGRKTITMIDALGVTINLGGGAPATPGTAGSTYYTNVGGFDSTITLAFPEGLTRRGAGRPFGLSRGRRQTTVPQR